MLRIGIVANEPSGDLLGARLMRAIADRVQDVRFEGIGGPQMIEAGCRSLFPMERLSVMGLVEVLRHLPDLLAIRRRLLEHFTADPPDLFIGVDAPDFNLGLERRLKQAGIPTVHYVSPTVWAWRSKRVKSIRRSVDLMLTIFPFEQAFLDQHGIASVYVGHPLADEIPLEVDHASARKQMKLAVGDRVLALLPGSRLSEIEGLAEVFLRAALRCKEAHPELKIMVPLVNRITRERFESLHQAVASALPVELLEGRAREVMQCADVVLVASGTATLEALLLKRPMVVAYRLNRLTYWLVRRFNLLKVPYVAMANLLAGRELAPEFIQDEATPEKLSAALLEIMDSPERISSIQAAYTGIHRELRQAGNEKAATAILALAGHGRV